MIACNDVSRADIGFASDENAMTVFFAESYHMKSGSWRKHLNRKFLNNWLKLFRMHYAVNNFESNKTANESRFLFVLF